MPASGPGREARGMIAPHHPRRGAFDDPFPTVRAQPTRGRFLSRLDRPRLPDRLPQPPGEPASAASEVLTGKAKFGIFGDGKEVAQVALARAFRPGDFRSGYYRDQTLMFALGIATLEEFFAQLYADPDVGARSALGRPLDERPLRDPPARRRTARCAT